MGVLDGELGFPVFVSTMNAASAYQLTLRRRGPPAPHEPQVVRICRVSTLIFQADRRSRGLARTEPWRRARVGGRLCLCAGLSMGFPKPVVHLPGEPKLKFVVPPFAV